jgi:hypothetical protein
MRFGTRGGAGGGHVRDGLGDELVDRRRHVPRICRCHSITREHRRRGHQRRRGVGGISGGLLNGGANALYRFEPGRLQPVDR